MADKFSGYADSVANPGTRAVAVAPNDGTDLTDVPKALYVGTGGDIAMIGVDAPAGAPGLVWKNVAAGSLLPFRARRILAAGTTATNILAVY